MILHEPYNEAKFVAVLLFRSSGKRKRQGSDLEMFMIDFETGKSYEYNLENLEALLMRDPEL